MPKEPELRINIRTNTELATLHQDIIDVLQSAEATYVEALGVLEMVKADLMDQAYRHYSDPS